MVYSKEFAEMWEALPAPMPTDLTAEEKRRVAITKTADLIFPDSSNALTVEASLKDIQVSRGDGGSIGKALGIKPKTTHFKLATPLGYKSIHDLRIVHAKDEVPPLKIGVTESEESIKARTIRQFNLYTNRTSVVVSPLPVGKER
jgi:hypothetical protein